MDSRRFEIYAPVIIPTLCRYEHFKRCLESLRKCTGAEYTDVYIGIDYPTKDSHWDGYNKICEYVSNIVGFHKLVIIKREKNFGPELNVISLRNCVKEHYDRCIISEDDNEFSPNFLEYMNECLTHFKDNPNVIRICGSKMTWGVDFNTIMKGYNNNIFPAKDYNASGSAIWFDKFFMAPYTKESVLKSWKLTYKAFRKGYCREQEKADLVAGRVLGAYGKEIPGTGTRRERRRDGQSTPSAAAVQGGCAPERPAGSAHGAAVRNERLQCEVQSVRGRRAAG